MSWQDTVNYIRHRLVTASIEGSEDQASNIFDSVAMAVIFYFSGGVPRLINTLSDFALVHAYAVDLKVVNYQTALEVVRGRTIGGVNRFKNNEQQLSLVREKVINAVGIDLAKVLDHQCVDNEKKDDLLSSDDLVL